MSHQTARDEFFAEVWNRSKRAWAVAMELGITVPQARSRAKYCRRKGVRLSDMHIPLGEKQPPGYDACGYIPTPPPVPPSDSASGTGS